MRVLEWGPLERLETTYLCALAWLLQVLRSGCCLKLGSGSVRPEEGRLLVVDETQLQGAVWCLDLPEVYDLWRRLGHLQKFAKELWPDLGEGWKEGRRGDPGPMKEGLH